jgi:hypothetical protein
MMLLGIVIIVGVVIAGGLLCLTTGRLDREIEAESLEGRE